MYGAPTPGGTQLPRFHPNVPLRRTEVMRPPPLVPRGGQTQMPLMNLLNAKVHQHRNHSRVNPRTGYDNSRAGAAGSINHLVNMAVLARMLQGAR